VYTRPERDAFAMCPGSGLSWRKAQSFLED
jgi:hypothetical protein